MTAKEGQVKALLKSSSEAADVIREHVEAGGLVRVESHLDADGLAAAGIMGVALNRLGARFMIRIERWLDEQVV
ncbi:MAG TPA: phosphoesterase, partial [Candidatus Bathyarchaeota archaeon]|nr:phosphoesterase [Candidatus Bathyarchaeota archaeon]